MSKEKQIEELIEELIRTNGYGTLNAVAYHLYNAGYRKQSEGEWESFPSLGNKYRCSHCKAKVESRTNFCPNCGARMKGGGE
jgi:hypothetical protein